MNRHIPILLLLVFFFSSGCKKFLDEPVLGRYDDENYFTSDANALSAITAAYVPLTFTDAAANSIWVLGDIASDDVIKGGLAGSAADYTNIDEFNNILPSNGALESIWKTYYDGIFRCNVVTDGLSSENTGVSEALKKVILAEAKFLRAYYYSELTSCFGSIPLRLKVESLAELQSPAVPQDQVYARIEKDLQEAAADLPETRPGAEAGRATKGAALALLARVYLNQQKWTQAAEAASAVEGLNIYKLTDDFSDNFKASAKNNQEVIFAVWHISAAQPNQGNSLNYWFAPQSLNGNGFFLPNQSLADNFERSPSGITDPRMDYTLAMEGKSYYDSDFDPSWTSTGFLSKKHIQPLSEVPKNTKNQGSLNYEAIRFAEVLLIKAEALNEAGMTEQALVPLNKLRKRARESFLFDESLPGNGDVPVDLLPDITSVSKEQARELIRRERRSELALEFHRFFDIVRYGKTYAETALAGTGFVYEQHRFFPIPQSERDTNKKLGL